MSETSKGSAATSKRAQKATTKGSAKEAVMYIGPNVAGVTVKGTLYKEGKLPKLLKKKIEEIPVLASLLVPVSRLAQAIKERSDPKSEISTCYANALAELEKGVSE